MKRLLLYDVTHDKWYQTVADERLFDFIDDVYSIGGWKEISNNIV